MRFLTIAAVLAFSAEAAASGAAGDFNTARSGAAYLSSPAADADACARRCAEDGLCIAWTFQSTSACELHANASAPIVAPGAYSGLSPRAPAFARALTLQALPAEAVNVSTTNTTPSGEDHLARAPRHEEAPDVAELLGGPADGDLRAGLDH